MTKNEIKILEQYFRDLYSLFLKKLAFYAIDAHTDAGTPVTLQAMLSEIIKIKKLLAEPKA